MKPPALAPATTTAVKYYYGVAHDGPATEYLYSASEPQEQYATVYHDAFDRLVEEDQAGGLDERIIYDGGSVLETLDSSDNATERYLNGAAVDQVLAVEEVGGSDAGVNWLLADAQETVRDVARAAYATPASVVDHVFLDSFGQENAPQSNSDPQLESPVGYEGLMIGPLLGFPSDIDVDSGGGSGGSAASDGGVGSADPEWDWGTSVIGLSYSVSQGWYDSVTGGYVTAAQQGYNAGVANPYVFQGDNPTITNLVPSFRPADPAAAVGINTTTGDLSGGGASPVWGDVGNGLPVVYGDVAPLRVAQGGNAGIVLWANPAPAAAAAQVKQINKEVKVTWKVKGAAPGAGDNTLLVTVQGDTKDNITIQDVKTTQKITTRWFYTTTVAVVPAITTPKNPKAGDPATVTYAVTVTWTAVTLPVIGILQRVIMGILKLTTTIKITISADGTTTANVVNNSNDPGITPVIK